MPRIQPRVGPDLSQRPRREAPAMLTGLAILERELGRVEFERHQLRRRLAGRPDQRAATVARRDLDELDRRRLQAIRLIADLRQEYEERTGSEAA